MASISCCCISLRCLSLTHCCVFVLSSCTQKGRKTWARTKHCTGSKRRSTGKCVCVCVCLCVCVCVCRVLLADCTHCSSGQQPKSIHIRASVHLAGCFAPQSVRAITSAPTPLQKTTAINHAMHVLLTSASAQHTAFAAAATTGAVNGDNHKPPSRTPMTADDLVPALCKRLCWVNKLCLHVPLCC